MEVCNIKLINLLSVIALLIIFTSVLSGCFESSENGSNSNDIPNTGDEDNTPPNNSSDDPDDTPPNDEWGDAYDFSFKTLKGNTIKLSDYLGKVILLDFMGVDCYWCYYQVPDLKAISENYTDLIIISIDVYRSETEEYLQSYIDWWRTNQSIDMDWDYGLDKNLEIAKVYVTEGGVPKIVIIDQKGNVYYQNVGYTRYHEIAPVLDELYR